MFLTKNIFIRNLRGTNGGGDHDPEMMAEVYQAIRNDEIVMPQEQTGLVKENYLWKLLLSRSMEEEDFILMDNGMFDHNLFGLTWGPAVASLSYIFDKSSEHEVQRKAVDGFSKVECQIFLCRILNIFLQGGHDRRPLRHERRPGQPHHQPQQVLNVDQFYGTSRYFQGKSL